MVTISGLVPSSRSLKAESSRLDVRERVMGNEEAKGDFGDYTTQRLVVGHQHDKGRVFCLPVAAHVMARKC
jgi:hypothetical protein